MISIEGVAEVHRLFYVEHMTINAIAEHLAMSGVSPFDIQKLLGHGNIKTTMRSMHLAPDHLLGLTDALLSTKQRIQFSSTEGLNNLLDKDFKKCSLKVHSAGWKGF